MYKKIFKGNLKKYLALKYIYTNIYIYNKNILL